MSNQLASWLKLIFFSVGLLGGGLASAGEKSSAPLPVYILTTDAALRERVLLTPEIQVVADLDQAKVIILHNTTPPPTEREALITQVREGKGLVILMGPKVEASFLGALYGGTVELKEEKDPVTVQFYQPTPKFWEELWDRLLRKTRTQAPHWSQTGQVDWSSIPQVYDRLALKPSPLTTGKALVLNEKSGEGVLFEGRAGQGRVYLLTAWLSVDPNASLSRKENKNYNLLVWPFFNYLLHGLIVEAAGQGPPPRFADWSGSPVFGPRDRRIIGWSIAALVLANLILFSWVRRWSQKHRTPLQGFAKALWTHDTFDLKTSRQENHWQDAGFYRPLSGFLISLGLGTFQGLTTIPLVIWAANNLDIFPAAKGMAALVWGTISVLYFVFDLGTGDAAIKFYSEYRAKDPERAVQYFQFLVWWQILSGLIQIILVTLAAFYLLPRTSWAYLSIGFVCMVACQWPGFMGWFFAKVFQAYQRFDYVQYLWFLNSVFFILFWISLRYGWRMWGAGHPRFGEAFSSFAFFELSFALLANCSIFAVGYFLYRRVGYPLKVMFMLHCSAAVIREAFKYGYKLTIRQLIDQLDQLCWVAILSILLINYLETSAIIATALGILGNYSVLDVIHSSIFPSFSEAYSQNRLALARHYVIQSLNWGFLGTALITSLTIVLIPPLNALLDPQWSRIGAILPLVFISGSVSFFARMPASLFKASGRTEFIPLVGGVLLALKVILLFLLVPSMQIFGPPVVLIFYSLADVALSWLLIRRYILRLNVNPFRLAIPNLLAGAIIFAVCFGLRLLLLPLGTPGLVALVILSLSTIGPFFWLTAIFGGWNEMTLTEFERATCVNRYAEKLLRPTFALIRWGRRHLLLPEYQPEDPAAVQADSDQIVAGRMHEDLRQAATTTLSTLGSWRQSRAVSTKGTTVTA